MIIAAVCGDAGGAAAVAPVIDALRQSGRETVRAFAYGHARDMWTERGVACETLPGDLSIAGAAHLLRTCGATLLLTGTSMNAEMHELRFIDASRDIQIPSLALLDSWVNYSARFAYPDAARRCVPDRIAVMDAQARTEMTANGFDPEILIVTGQPACDDLLRYRRRFTAEDRRALRGRFGVGDADLLVVFVSQPLSTLYGAPDNPGYFGFDEHSVLALLVDALDHVAGTTTRAITLLVRPHPREDSRPAAPPASRRVRTLVSRDSDGRDVAMAADLVTGMSSHLLIDACYLRCPTVSLQPGLRRADILPTNRIGLTVSVYDARDVKPAIASLLTDESARAALVERLTTYTPPGGATARVVELIERMTTTRIGPHARV